MLLRTICWRCELHVARSWLLACLHVCLRKGPHVNILSGKQLLHCKNIQVLFIYFSA